jgi:hypothetical protein
MVWFSPTTAESQTENGPENLTSYYLPNGLNLNNRKEYYYVSSKPVMLISKATLKPSETITFQNSTTLLFSTSVLRVPPSDFPVGGTWQSTHIDISAVECWLYLCIKEFNSKVVNNSLVEDSKEIAATRDPDSFSVNLGDAGTLSFPEGKVSPDVDALYSNVTLFPRTPLVIKMPPMSNSSNLNNKQVDIPQKVIDSLSFYILSIFDEGTYFNTSTKSKDTGCSFSVSSIPCAGPQSISGMAVGNSSLLVKYTSSPTDISPTVTKLLYNSNDLGELGTLKAVLDVRWAWIIHGHLGIIPV